MVGVPATALSNCNSKIMVKGFVSCILFLICYIYECVLRLYMGVGGWVEEVI